MRKTMLLISLLQMVIAGLAHAESRYQEVVVIDPYLEMHTGPGRGYPVFNVAERGDTVRILKSRTEWYKIENNREISGWVHIDQMEQTLFPDGGFTSFTDATHADSVEANWEMGFMGGDFGGADVITGWGAYRFTPNLSAELRLNAALGNFFNSYYGTINIVHLFFPEWRVSPYFQMGTGVIHTAPKTTLVGAEDRTDQLGVAGLGVRAYVSRRFVFRAEYNSYVVFTSRDDNEEVNEWKAGFSFFF